MNSTYSTSKKITLFGTFFIIGFAAAILLVKLVPYINMIIASTPYVCEANGNLISNRTEARTLFSNHSIPTSSRPPVTGGYITKDVLCALYSSMTNPLDLKVYYYFGRDVNNLPTLMLFSDPAYHPNISGNAYKILPSQYCPPECSSTLDTYLR